MIRLIQILIILMVLRILWRAIRDRLQARQIHRVSGAAAQAEVYGGAMVRDPVCGIYIPEASSLRVRRGGETHHFCSAACLEAFHRTEPVAG